MRRLLAVLLLPIVGCADGPTSSPALSPDGAAPTEHRGVRHGKLVAVFNTQLRPENEVRVPGATFDPTVESVARGHAQIKIYEVSTNQYVLECKVQIHNPAREVFTAGHIHVGGPTVVGGVAVGLHNSLPNISDEHIKLECGPISDPDIAAILLNPSNFYVNYHTTLDPVGAIRGHLP